jgi:Domain of unknown function (DUF4158)
VATRLFADEELARLREFPDISRDELFRYFTLTPADLAFVDPGRGRGPADRLGVAVALCSLPWLGFVPDKVASAPPVAVARLADQLKVDADDIRSYGKRAQTRTDHLKLVAQYLGWRPAAAMELKELDECAEAFHRSPSFGLRNLLSFIVFRAGTHPRRNVSEPHPGNTGRRSARLRSLAGYRQLASATPSTSSTPPDSPAWPPDDATMRWLCSVGSWVSPRV